jgi:hypothetical protein
VTVPVAEHTYSYLAPSAVVEDEGRAEVSLATSGGRAPNPYFFTGFLGAPRQTAQALLVVAEVARTRYYEPPNMVAARILAADPVVTSNLDRLRFESFSACAGVYARLDLEPGVLDGKPREWGTTNVDFNPPMRSALARVHDDEAMLMHVGHDEVKVETLGGGAVEKKVPLPERWLKGFAEVQVASAHMMLRHELPGVEARRFLQSLPRTKSRSVAWATPAGKAKSPELPRTAVDVIVATIEDGRFDADALGEALAWLADHDLAKLNRLEAPFRDAARVSPQTSAQVLRTIEALLAHAALKPPRTVLSVLDVAVEASAASGLRIEDERARSTLERLGADVSRSSKLGKATAALL